MRYLDRLSAGVTIAACIVVLAHRAADAADLPPGYWPLAQSQELIDKTQRVRLAPDLSHLGAGERAALAKLLEAGRVIQELYERQQHPQAQSALKALQELDRQLGSPADTKNLLTLYALAQGPIAEKLDNSREAFLPVEPTQPGKNVYPWAIGKDEIEAWLTAHPEQRGSILALRSVVHRADADTVRSDLAALQRHPTLAVLHPGLQDTLERLAAAPDPAVLYAVPYSVAFADSVLRIYALLNEAAGAVEAEDADFARFLRNRSRDLLSDDYESGDAAWVTGRFKNLNAQIGSYETYDDELYGNKSFFTMSLQVRRKAETEALRKAMKGLQGLEDSLPYGRHKRVREDIPAGIYDVIADFGEARGGNTATILPNEAYLVRRYGRVIMLRANILQHPELFAQYKGRWAAVVAPEFRDELTLDGDLNDTLWHEVGHYLGVDRTLDGRNLDDALEDAASTLEELKADLVSLFVGEALERKGYYDAAKLKSHYTSGIARVIINNKPRRDQPYDTMMLMQWNFYMENGLLAFDPATGTLRIGYEAFHAVVGKLLAAILALQDAGDKPAADRFIARYTTWDDNVHGVIAAKWRDAAHYRFTLYGYAATGD